MIVFAAFLRRVFIALVVAAAAAGSASAASRAMSGDCVTGTALHAEHAVTMQGEAGSADDKTGPAEIGHTCLHCEAHGCAAVLAISTGSAEKTKLWPTNAPSMSQHAATGQRPETLQRPPKA